METINLNGFFEQTKNNITDKLNSIINWREITISEYIKHLPQLVDKAEIELIQLRELYRKISAIREDI